MADIFPFISGVSAAPDEVTPKVRKITNTKSKKILILILIK